MTPETDTASALRALASELEGELSWDAATRAAYATDASIYRALPLAMSAPKSTEDARALIRFANARGIPLIPRAAGTSLAGQVVGEGIVVDISKYWTRVLELNVAEKWVRIQPGVIRDELNQFLKPHGLMFAPETSTSNRCMIGGMAGNNSCGVHSLIHGSTRDHVLEIKALLSDGSEAIFGPLDRDAFERKAEGESLEARLYRKIRDILEDPENASAIRQNYPRPDIRRRNTGYALDLLLDDLSRPEASINLCKLLCGSEGTLAFFTELKLSLVRLPPRELAVVAVHLHSIPEAARATLVARRFQPTAIELIDDVILRCAKTNIEQAANRAFVEGDPGALVVVEFAAETPAEIDAKTAALEAALRAAGLGSSFPVLRNAAVDKVWALRNAGLGVIMNVPGDRKPLDGVEDTAIHPDELPEYVDAVLEIMRSRGVECVSYAHIGDGEIHFRPMLDPKRGPDRKLYREIAEEMAKLVKRHRGSLSGEHGDGKARAEFLRMMIGDRSYELCRELKRAWDPRGIFNPGKIVDAPPAQTDLRYDADQPARRFDTVFDFSSTGGILRMAEKCNGAGVCRKTEKTGGVMCPSYMATRDEKDTTRARANVLREFLTRSDHANPFDHDEIAEVMELCIGCKGCKSECPSNVDVSRLKAEFLHQRYKTTGIPSRAKALGNVAALNWFGHLFRFVSNILIANTVASQRIKAAFGIAPARSLPFYSRVTTRAWAKRNLRRLNPPPERTKGVVHLFCDEYTNYTEAQIGIAAIELLTRLGYSVEIPAQGESGRALISQGLLVQARKAANRNVAALAKTVSADRPLLGIEPSAILSFRDEYPDLVDARLRPAARALAPNCMLVEEFLIAEIDAGRIEPSAFDETPREIRFHGHCHQKAITGQECSSRVLRFPRGHRVEVVKSGCCGMAGAFGYGAEHFELSQRIGEFALFPALRAAPPEAVISANGTSCRHQIKDALGLRALHPVEILRDALARG